MFTQDTIDRLIGADVIDSTGEKVGSVGQVFLDDQTNQPSWVTVNTGLFGTKETFIPLEGASMDGDVVRISHDKAHIKDAPTVDADNGHLSPAEEQELYRYYRLDPGTVEGERTVADRTAADVDSADVDSAKHESANLGAAQEEVQGDGTMHATAHSERLNVGTEQFETGRVRLRKYVTTEEQHVTVPVSKEHLVVERQAVDDRPVAGGLDAQDGDVYSEEITLREERPVVTKETFETERVNIGKRTVTEDRVVSGDVSSEHIEVEGGDEFEDAPDRA